MLFEFSNFQNAILKSMLDNDHALHSFENIISWFTNLKMYASLDIERCNVNEIADWELKDGKISHISGRYFEVIGVDCVVGNRELLSWSQPLLKQREEGIIGFIVKKINGIMHLLVQAKMESGNLDILEMAPTVQCITGSYKNPEFAVEYLNYFLQKKGVTHYDVIQSEEGGRFYHEQNQNIVIEVADDELECPHKNFIWMTFKQAKEFIKFNNYFNIEARSLIACITPI